MPRPNYIKFSTEPHDPAYGAGLNDWVVVSQDQFNELSYHDDADIYENEDGKFILFYVYNKERADREEW